MAGVVRFLHLFAGAFFFLSLPRTGLAVSYGGSYQGGCCLLDQTIFCLGGYPDVNMETGTNAFFGLNISQPIKMTEAERSWVDLTRPSNNVAIEANLAFAMESVPQRGFLVVDGGSGSNNTELNSLTTLYYPSNNTWVNVAVSERDFQQTIEETMTADARGNNLFMWGGESTFANTSGYFSYPREMKRLNLDTGVWSRLSSPAENILPRTYHTSVLGKDNQTIYFFGGLETGQLVNETDNTNYYYYQYASMTEILSYNTVNDSWNVTITTGEVVPPRRYLHTATLIGSGEIVLYGGANMDLTSKGNITIYGQADDLYIFNTDSMSWRNQTISSGNDTGPDGIFGHSAIYAGNDSLFFLFGMSQNGMNTRFNILNTKQWAWTTTFSGIHPTPVTNATESPTSAVDDNGGGGSDGDGGGLSSGGIAGVVVGVIAGLAIIAVAGFFLYRARRKSSACTNEPTAPMSDPKMSEDINNSHLSSTQPQNPQGRTSFTLKMQPTPLGTTYAAGKPDVLHSNVINEGVPYIPQLRMGAVKPEGE